LPPLRVRAGCRTLGCVKGSLLCLLVLIGLSYVRFLIGLIDLSSQLERYFDATLLVLAGLAKLIALLGDVNLRLLLALLGDVARVLL
jgi:hypothetical protein